MQRWSYITAESLCSPLDPPGELSYVYVYQSMDEHPDNVLAYEKTENYGDLGTWVVFLNGSVQYMDIVDFQAALDATYARLP